MYTSHAVENGPVTPPSPGQDDSAHHSLLHSDPQDTYPEAYIAAAPYPAENERLTALRSYDILDTPVEAAFDDLTRLASIVCNTPIALIGLVEDTREWFKSGIGIAKRELPIAESFCAHALHVHGFVEIRDTLADPRFKLHPNVAGGLKVRFYAAAVLRTPDGLPLGTICVLDYRPRHLTAKQRDALTSLCRQVMAQIEFRHERIRSDLEQARQHQCANVTGHDLKQPLQVMVMALDRIKDKVSDSKDRNRLDYAIDAGFRMGKELDQLTATNASKGETVQLRSFPIEALFTTIGNTWNAFAKAKGIELIVVSSTAHIISDPEMLRLVIGNLVANAVKYTSSGRVLLGVRRRGGSLLIEVMDTGTGIPADYLGTIHDPFVKIDPETDGLGLGLSIVRQSADKLGHKISLRSEVGRGTHVTVTVPEAVPHS